MIDDQCIPNDRYLFKLRTDMPSGFMKNKRHPELPMLTEFLRQYDGKEESFDTFKSLFNKAPGVIVKGILDKDELVGGLLIRKAYKGQQGNSLYIVSTLASQNATPGHPGLCDFGSLERISKGKE